MQVNPEKVLLIIRPNCRFIFIFKISNAFCTSGTQQLMENHLNRRRFIKNTAMSGIGLSLYTSPFSYVKRNANETIHVAIMGTNSRGAALAQAFAMNPDCHVAYICDVDDQAIQKGIKATQDAGQSDAPKAEKDFRRALEDPQLDALVIAAPDHWHAPAAMLALQANKHVYVEKPCSHNPQEGEMLVSCAQKHGKVVMMGNQRRSWPNVIEAINQVRNGAIGNVYLAKAWYANTRGSIGTGKPVAVPAHLDFELWQGPAPRHPYLDNIVHYNWHWRWHWGTGELLNNGTHFIDVCRWGLEVDYPEKVSSFGGRYHYHDDWETPDTQSVIYEFPYGKSIFWESRSSNGRSVNGHTTGVSFHGEEGTLEMGGGNAYKIYDLKNKLVKEVSSNTADALNTTGPGFDLDKDHVINFVDAIRYDQQPRTHIEDANKSVHICHLGNIAYRVGKSLQVDAGSGRLVNAPEAMQHWGRDYESGWEPVV